MQLAEQGKLDLKTDVNTYLKAFKIPVTYSEPHHHDPSPGAYGRG